MCCTTTYLTQHMGIVISIKWSKNDWNYLKSVTRAFSEAWSLLWKMRGTGRSVYNKVEKEFLATSKNHF